MIISIRTLSKERYQAEIEKLVRGKNHEEIHNIYYDNSDGDNMFSMGGVNVIEIRKKLCLTLCFAALFGTVLFVSGCGDNSVDKEDEQNPPDIAGYEMSEIPLNLSDGWVAADVSANDTAVFYVSAVEQEMGLQMVSAKIGLIDLATGEERSLYKLENKSGFYINELTALPDLLYWVQTENGQASIEEMNLVSGEIRELESYNEPDRDILLQTDGKYLTWILVEDGKTCLRAYDTEKSEIFDISENIDSHFPYARVNVSDGICSFPTKNNGKYLMNVYELKSRTVLQQFEMDDDAEIFNVAADDERCVYSLLKGGAADSKIHVYNYSNGSEEEINGAGDLYIFSWVYSKGKLIINERNNNSILISDLSGGETVSVNDQKEHLFILDGITRGGKYYVLDMIDDTAPMMYLIDIVD